MELKERKKKKSSSQKKVLKDKGNGQGQEQAQKQSWLHANEGKEGRRVGGGGEVCGASHLLGLSSRGTHKVWQLHLKP